MKSKSVVIIAIALAMPLFFDVAASEAHGQITKSVRGNANLDDKAPELSVEKYSESGDLNALIVANVPNGNSTMPVTRNLVQLWSLITPETLKTYVTFGPVLDSATIARL